MSELIKHEAFSMTPKSFDEAMQFAKLIADSDLAPKDFKGKPGNVLVAVQMGVEVGLPPMQAIQNIAVINGRPALWGDAMLALVMNHSTFEGIHEETKDGIAYCTVRRKGMEQQTRTFSLDQAKKAGLLGKAGPWTQYPERMLAMRARGFALRDIFPDVLKGIISREEAEDSPNDSQPLKPTKAAELNKKLGLTIDATPEPAAQEVNHETGEVIEANNEDEPMTLEHVKFMIESATKISHLINAVDYAKVLPEEDRKIARTLYKEKERELNVPN